ncbi:Plant self-incompatibility protein S1 family [Raphanus sativus]|uniref:S-protein homolog n=1 Tax=Raphanus sativus TaxID=3726 RepID=A0A6J0K8I8_RAPSA|nr:S-protein homolog 9-like [Raphanus sativus]KAJ4882476.1 Plant self-incompatibility protein S1 family [Raphanus sativus]
MLDGNGITFSNELKYNKLLKVRCDNVEGEHLLKIGEEYEFTLVDVSFHYCTMSQGPNNFKHHQKFDVYDGLYTECPSKCYDRDTQCKWIARENGIYFSSVDYPPTKKYEWNIPHLLKN